MRFVISILVLVFYLSWIFAPIIKVSDYFINLTDYKEKCINKEKVKLLCNGKCQLAKTISEEETEPALNIQHYDFTIAFICVGRIEEELDITKKEITFTKYINLYTYQIINVIFKPPIF